MAKITLSTIPEEKEFEEYISAVFQCNGYYVERNIVDRAEGKDVLELDIVVTNYDKNPPETKLVEVKSKDCKFSDIFKVRGWMHYLNFERGMFITKENPDHLDFLVKKADSLNIDLISVPNLDESHKIIAKTLNSKNNEDDIDIWRFSYWIERNLLKRLNHQNRVHKDKLCFKNLKYYYFKLNSDIFFVENAMERLIKLYETFQKCPLISAKCGHELIGKEFNNRYGSLPRSIYSETYSRCELNPIQMSTLIEHRARLAILKNVIDYKHYRESVDIKNPNRTLWRIISTPPNSFWTCFDSLDEHEYYYKYPIFWQWFILVFGGFILKDYEEEEFKNLSEKTGLPEDEIPNALEFYETLFNQKNGWFTDLSSTGSNIKLMKFLPVPFMGIGAHYRKGLYLESNEFKDLDVKGDRTLSDLIKWNNLGYKVLSIK